MAVNGESDLQTNSKKHVTLHSAQLFHSMLFASMPITNHLKTSSCLLFLIGKWDTEVLMSLEFLFLYVPMEDLKPIEKGTLPIRPS